MKQLLIIIFVIGMFVFAKFCCQEKQEWSTACKNQQAVNLPAKP